MCWLRTSGTLGTLVFDSRDDVGGGDAVPVEQLLRRAAAWDFKDGQALYGEAATGNGSCDGVADAACTVVVLDRDQPAFGGLCTFDQ